MSKKKPLPVVEGLEITGVAAEGKSLARWNDLVVFIPYGAPGDVADVRITALRLRASIAVNSIIIFLITNELFQCLSISFSHFHAVAYYVACAQILIGRHFKQHRFQL